MIGGADWNTIGTQSINTLSRVYGIQIPRSEYVCYLTLLLRIPVTKSYFLLRLSSLAESYINDYIKYFGPILEKIEDSSIISNSIFPPDLCHRIGCEFGPGEYRILLFPLCSYSDSSSHIE